MGFSEKKRKCIWALLQKRECAGEDESSKCQTLRMMMFVGISAGHACMLVILRGVVYCLFFEVFYSGLCISYALTHPLLQVQSLVEKSKLSKSRQYSAIKSCKCMLGEDLSLTCDVPTLELACRSLSKG
jgi:hypothetical protein